MAKRELEVLVGGCTVSKELLNEGLSNDRNMLGASALVNANSHDLVTKTQRSFMDAGATMITTSNYDVVPGVGFTGEEIREYTRHAARLAVEARKEADKESTVKICGSLPPLMPSFRSDRTIDRKEGHETYLLIGEALWPFVDVYVLETMSSVNEAKMAYEAVYHLKKPVMVSFALGSSGSGSELRSGEPVLDTIEKLLAFSDQLAANDGIDNALAAILFNCSQPEVIAKALKLLSESEIALEMLRGHGIALGGYGNRISPTSKAGRQEEKIVAGAMQTDLDMEIYSQFAVRWVDFGASIVGGCCGISPKYIADVAAEVLGP